MSMVRTLRVKRPVMRQEKAKVTVQARSTEVGVTVEINTIVSVSQERNTTPVSHQPGRMPISTPRPLTSAFSVRIRRRISRW